jgi:mRNA interferase RelE/StbE
MTYQVKLTLFANDAARKLNPEIKKAAKAALKELAENPSCGKELQAELSGFRSYRFMRYRIIYKIDTANKHLVVWAIGHRRDIYENLGDSLLRLTAESK